MSAPLRDSLLPLEAIAADLRQTPSLPRYRRLVRVLVDRLYAAADIMEGHEAVIADLFALGDDAIANVERLEAGDPRRSSVESRQLRSRENAARIQALKVGRSWNQVAVQMQLQDGKTWTADMVRGIAKRNRGRLNK